MTTPEYLSEFNSFYVDFNEGTSLLANGDYNYRYFQRVHGFLISHTVGKFIKM